VEHVIQLHIEKLPEGVYLATSDEVQGLVAQGRTIQETIEIARDVARKLIEARSGPNATPLPHCAHPQAGRCRGGGVSAKGLI
jgi:predicted RNase H-like HicB family nuclease